MGNSIGLKRNTVKLHNYSSEWPKLYQYEADSIRKVLGNVVVGIEHIGSTSVPGMLAKPIIDIDVGIKRMLLAKRCIRPLETLGYVMADIEKTRDHWILSKRKDETVTHHLHLVKYGGRRWKRDLELRNFLRSNPALAEAYCLVKKELSKKYPNDRFQYTYNKGLFIQPILKLARTIQN